LVTGTNEKARDRFASPAADVENGAR